MMMPFFCCCCCYSLCTGSSLFPDFSFPQSLNGFPSSYADSLETPPPQRSSILMSVFSYPALLPVTIYSLILSSKQSDKIRSDQSLSRVLLKAVRTACVRTYMCVCGHAHMHAQSCVCLFLLLNCKFYKDKSFLLASQWGHIFNV